MRLIDADKFSKYADKPSIYDTTDLKAMIDEQPTVNISNNNCGVWDYIDYDSNPKIGNYHCSVCRSISILNRKEKFCSNCGSQMKLNNKEYNHMRKFISVGIYQYGEQQAIEQGTNKSFTLTQKATLFTSDYYSVCRFIAVENADINAIAEPDSYVYQFNYMVTGCTLTSVIVDEQTALQFISNNLLSFMQGKINSKIFQEYLQKHLTS